MDNENGKTPAQGEAVNVDIWSQLLELKSREKDDDSVREASIVFIGSRSSGKSTLIHAYMFKDKEDTPKPTTCLDYKYTRSSVGMSMEKDLSHFWELGGGRKLVSLLDIPLTPATIQNTLIIITLDLSKPSTVVDCLKYWLDTLRKRVKTCMAKLASTDIPTKCQAAAVEAFGAEHEDIAKVELWNVPILIVANKFDLFKDTESELLKTMAKTLRAIAHANGASLLYTSKRAKALMQTFRSRISRHVLNRAPSKNVQMEHTKPLSIPAGSDSFAQIGFPSDGAGSQSAVQAWCSTYAKYFPRNAEAEKSQNVEIEDLELAPEQAVDHMLAQRDEDLKQIKRKMALKRRMQQADNQVAADKR